MSVQVEPGVWQSADGRRRGRGLSAAEWSGARSRAAAPAAAPRRTAPPVGRQAQARARARWKEASDMDAFLRYLYGPVRRSS
jgi:hypothetical protein